MRLPEIDGAAVKWCIPGLVARSLVEVDYGRQGVRYRLTNATRHYAGKAVARPEALAIMRS